MGRAQGPPLVTDPTSVPAEPVERAQGPPLVSDPTSVPAEPVERA